ncbi:hypothetical protein [Nostoc sp. FACHB-190]|uniref:hypothetical protein n=1 Tax=Nostoc sp. FACHB-190 TaxID=2692838 RepID=UPI001681E6DB|nr:hypothetical protein [Nostoc sp. FACHB-190]MBD2303020.1 hypothetical protein [Nostoc sp. FACHB-190]
MTRNPNEVSKQFWIAFVLDVAVGILCIFHQGAIAYRYNLQPLVIHHSQEMCMHNSQQLPEDFKAFEQQILQAENQIAKATTELFRLEFILDRICHEIQDSLGFDFVNISLVIPASNTIEAVHGIGIGKNWVNRARHYLEDDPELRDIQADIVKECHTEIIAGHNERFDSWIFETFDHHNLVRIFTPIILMRDESGKTLEDWFEQYDWQENFVPNHIGTEKQHTIITMKPIPGYAPPKVIGSVEAGYENCDTKITHQQAIALAKLVAQRSLDIRKARLRYVLETVAENARHILRADFTTNTVANLRGFNTCRNGMNTS